MHDYQLAARKALIHIGLPKAASTYLQGHWKATPGINVAHTGMMQLIAVAEAEAAGKGRMATDKIPWKPDQPWEAGQKLILSNEGFSGRYLGQGVDKKLIRRYRESICGHLKKIAPNGKILIVSREPDGFIRSAYGQHIKEGGVVPFSEFLEQERGYLLETPNINGLIELYADVFGRQNILVLPMSGLSADRDGFLTRIAEFAKLPPVVSVGGRVLTQIHNASLTARDNEMLRLFNRFLSAMGTDATPDQEKVLAQFRYLWRGMQIEFLQAKTPARAEQLEAFYDQIGVTEPGHEPIPEELIAEIRRRQSQVTDAKAA